MLFEKCSRNFVKLFQFVTISSKKTASKHNYSALKKTWRNENSTFVTKKSSLIKKIPHLREKWESCVYLNKYQRDRKLRAWRSSSQIDKIFSPETVLCCGHYADLSHKFLHLKHKNCDNFSTNFSCKLSFNWNEKIETKIFPRKTEKLREKVREDLFENCHICAQQTLMITQKYIVNVFLAKRHFLTSVDRLNLSVSGGVLENFVSNFLSWSDIDKLDEFDKLKN